MYYGIFSPSHRLAKRNACGTKRYGVVACQPVPTACRSSNTWAAGRPRPPAQPWAALGQAAQDGRWTGTPVLARPPDGTRCPGFLISLQMASAQGTPVLHLEVQLVRSTAQMFSSGPGRLRITERPASAGNPHRYLLFILKPPETVTLLFWYRSLRRHTGALRVCQKPSSQRIGIS